MMTPAHAMIALATAAALGMLGLWVWQRRQRDAGIVDVGWAAGLALAAAWFASVGSAPGGRRLALLLVAGVWATRLASYLYRHRVHRPGVGEDGRYARMRAAMGARADWGFLIFFQFQALLIALFAVPFAVVAWHDQSPLGWSDAAGLALGWLAIAGESVADRQLTRFRADALNRGHTCQRGLWRYSRHPNYFFEWLHWFAYPLLALGSPWQWLAWGGPVLMLLFLWKVTGIPHTERQALSHRPDYADYRRRTSAFIPWFPRARGKTP